MVFTQILYYARAALTAILISVFPNAIENGSFVSAEGGTMRATIIVLERLNSK
jgi:hypothetical protein